MPLEIDRLWAAWRLKYVSEADKVAADGGCVFCELPKMGDEAALVVDRGEHAYCVLNLYPYNSGHLMVIPYRHVGSITELEAAEGADVLRLAQRAVGALEAEYGPQGFNLGANMGRAAGAGIPAHFHLHVLPRWAGDTNFLTTIGGAKSMPEELAETWRRVHARLACTPS